MKTPQLWSITVCFIVVSVEFQIETGLNWGSLGLVIWIYRFYWRPLLCKVDHFKLGIKFLCSFEFWVYEKNSCIILNRSMKPSRLNLFWFARKIFSENFWCIIIFPLHGGESKNFYHETYVICFVFKHRFRIHNCFFVKLSLHRAMNRWTSYLKIRNLTYKDHQEKGKNSNNRFIWGKGYQTDLDRKFHGHMT